MSLNEKLNMLNEKISEASKKITDAKLRAKAKFDKEEEREIDRVKDQYKQKRFSQDANADHERQQIEEEFGKIGAKLIYENLEADYQTLQDRSEYSEVLEMLDEEQIKRSKEIVATLKEQTDEKQRQREKRLTLLGMENKNMIRAIEIFDNEGVQLDNKTITSYISYTDTGQCYVAIPVDGDKNKKLTNSLEEKITLACSEVSEARIEGFPEPLTFNQNLITDKEFLIYELTIQDSQYIEKFSKVIKERIENLSQLELQTANLTHNVEEISFDIFRYFLRFKKTELEDERKYVPMEKACEMTGLDKGSLKRLANKGKIQKHLVEEMYEESSLQKYSKENPVESVDSRSFVPETSKDIQERAKIVYARLESYSSQEYMGARLAAQILGIGTNGVLNAIRKQGLVAQKSDGGEYQIRPSDLKNYLDARFPGKQNKWFLKRKPGEIQ